MPLNRKVFKIREKNAFVGSEDGSYYLCSHCIVETVGIEATLNDVIGVSEYGECTECGYLRMEA